MSTTVSDCYSICNSPINCSKSKMLFSFPKDDRFKSIRITSCDKFYNIPVSLSKRYATFGVGMRTFLTKFSNNPPPNRYALLSIFNDQKKSHRYTFGINRDFYRKVYVKGQLPLSLGIPGPGTYNTRSIPGKESVKFSLRPKTTLDDSARRMDVPGPGSYNLINSVSPKGNQFLSKFESSKASVFNPPNSKRFPNSSFNTLKFPGPGSYNPKTNIDKTGNYFLSTLPSSMCRTFSIGTRKFFSTKNSNIDTPGPGSYRMPSEFGYYEAQPKFINEYKRTDKLRESKMIINRKIINSTGSRIQRQFRSASQKVL